jgi:hypothetical protein
MAAAMVYAFGHVTFGGGSPPSPTTECNRAVARRRHARDSTGGWTMKYVRRPRSATEPLHGADTPETLPAAGP